MGKKGRKVTIYDVAERAGVSASTVSRVLNRSGYASPETYDLVHAVAKELGYVPNPLAEGLRGKSTGVVGLVIPDIVNPFWPDVVRGAEDTLREHGYQVIFVNTDGELEREREALELMYHRRVDGVMLAPISVTVGDLTHLVDAQVPIVIMGRGIDDPLVDLVYTDNVKGAYLAVEHLLKLGHRRIAFVGTQALQASYRDRLNGYRAAHESYGVPVSDDLTVCGESLRSAVDSEQFERLLRADEPPTAVFAMQDILALQCWEIAESVGLAVPKDLSIVGFDDIPFAAFFRAGLTTVRQLRYERGSVSARMLIERLQGKSDAVSAGRRILLEPQLIVRGSTASQGKR